MTTRSWPCIFLLVTLFLLPAFLYASESPDNQSPQFEDIDSLKKQLAATEAQKGADHADLVSILDQIAKAYREKGGYVAAQPFAQRALQITQKVHGSDSLESAGEMDFLGTLYLLQGETKSAITQYESARQIVEKKLGQQHPAFAFMLTNLAKAHMADGRNSEAGKELEKALDLAGSIFGPAAPEITEIQVTAGELFLRTGRYARAEQMFVFALTVRSEGAGAPEASGQITHKEVLFGMAPINNLLGRLYSVTGLYEKAGPLLHQALEDTEAVTGSEHPAIEGILANLAAFSDATGDTTQAVAYRKRAAELHEKNMGFAFPANSPGPEALASVVPVRTGLRPFGNVHVGDWVVFSDGKNPVQRKEVIKKTPVVVIVSEQMRDPEKKEWMSTREGIVELSSNLSDLYDVDESQWKLVKVKIKDAEIVALSTDIKQEDGTCKVYLALDTIPVGGLARMECGSQLLLQATDYGRGK